MNSTWRWEFFHQCSLFNSCYCVIWLLVSLLPGLNPLKYLKSCVFLVLLTALFWFSGSAHGCQAVCFNWQGHSGWIIATYWHFWGWFVLSSGWWAGSQHTEPVIFLAAFEVSGAWILSVFVLSSTCVCLGADFPSYRDRLRRYICFPSRTHLEVNAFTCSKGKFVDLCSCVSAGCTNFLVKLCSPDNTKKLCGIAADSCFSILFYFII